jgi:hypothetical protein
MTIFKSLFKSTFRKPQTTAGKLTDLWSSCALLRSLTLASLFLVVTSAGLVSSSAALASFGFAGGTEAPSVVVSNSANPAQPTEANPNDLDTQAGSHPFDMTTTFKTNLDPEGKTTGEYYSKDISVDLPSGFAGSIVSVPQCRISDLSLRPRNVAGPGCPTSSQTGVAEVIFGYGGYLTSPMVPVYNMVPSDGGTAELAFHVLPVVQPILVTARTDGDYGLVAQTTNISQYVPFAGLRITLWGVPADPRHDAERFLPENGVAHLPGPPPPRPGNEKGEPLSDSAPPTAFLTNPTKCGPAGDYEAKFIGDGWEHPGSFEPFDGRPLLSDPHWQVASTSMYPAGVTGCNKLAFNPSLTVTPDTTEADSPSGYGVDLHVPQSIAPNDLATPALNNAVATLPQGLAINPGAADGLQACTENGAEPPGSAGNEIGFGSNAQPTCPHASQIGTVTVTTPVLPNALEGEVYLAADHSGNTYAVFIVIRGEGLLIKLKSTVVANPVTGQLTASFLNNPQFPFTDFVLHFYGGPRAVFVNPSACGPATTSMDLTPWSAGPGGTGDATPLSTFDVSFNGLGGACPFPVPFNPSFTAGTTSIQAGGYSPFSATFSRNDADQRVDHVQVKTPPGLLGTLANVPLCGEPQASLGTCSTASQIGHVTVGVGSGAAPLYLPIPGQPPNPVYLTGPYKGAPFGLSFVIPAIAGPYNLGTVVVRAAINVDPNTAALTITSDPLPTIIDGIPIQVKTVNVLIDRPDFVFNPTNCSPMSIRGSVTSREGSTASFSSPFQVTGCGDLGFKPGFKVSTSGKTSKARGASLDARVSFPKGALGTQANIAKVKVDLPKQLPSRLTTLQKACTAATFDANPGGCPAASVIGVVKAVTPTLPTTLTGPVYFVSHGGEAFPSLVIVLQGDGVRVDLTAATFISKAGITSSTFRTVPDVPVSSFELYLPEGPYSALTANGRNLCGSKLVMPTVFTAQNGLTMRQSTRIAVTGCPKAKASKARKARRARKASHRDGNGRRA